MVLVHSIQCSSAGAQAKFGIGLGRWLGGKVGNHRNHRNSHMKSFQFLLLGKFGFLKVLNPNSCNIMHVIAVQHVH